MNVEDKFIGLSSLIGEPSRACMLWNLLDGRAYTAGELALCADISPQSASNHLNRLLQANLVATEIQGRHRYYRFARPEVAYAVEALANLATDSKNIPLIEKKAITPVAYCRTCYDHLAGQVSISIVEGLICQGYFLPGDTEFEITPPGWTWFAEIGINRAAVEKTRRSLARKCLDWSERKAHLGGALGAALLQQTVALDWLRPTKESRAMVVTSLGRQRLSETLRIEV
jgi:DNA-binding transcriptional ArsR family regulator